MMSAITNNNTRRARFYLLKMKHKGYIKLEQNGKFILWLRTSDPEVTKLAFNLVRNINALEHPSH